MRMSLRFDRGHTELLRSRLAQGRVLQVPGVSNPFVAKLAERAGFEAVFVTGAGVANETLGLPDIGLVTMSEMTSAIRRVANAVDVPVVADIDTGYGNHLGVRRTVQEAIAAGAAAVVLEDQAAPKRCGHFDGKHIISVRDMVAKLVAAVDAREETETLVIARTDAIATEGFDAAIGRAQAYVRAGADIIFIEAPRTLREIEEIPRLVPAPCLINMVEGGVTPLLDAAALQDLGYRMVLHANLALRVGGHAISQAFDSLRAHGGPEQVMDAIMPWNERQNLVDLDRWERYDGETVDRASAILETVGAEPVTEHAQ